MNGKVVCVTGASWYIASWLVKLLLQKEDPKKTEHLRQLEGANERLHLLKGNLLKRVHLIRRLMGVKCLPYSSSFYHGVSDPEVELIDPAVKGTYVLDLVQKLPSKLEGGANFFSALREAAMEVSKEQGIDIVTKPAMVIGPLSGQLHFQHKCCFNFNLITNGMEKNGINFPNASFGWIKREDVCKCTYSRHLRSPSANGRYCLVERVIHFSEVVKSYSRLFPDLNFLKLFCVVHVFGRCVDDEPFVRTYHVSKEKAKSLGISYIPLDVSLKETIESLKEKKLA
ncbi:unnamed protein product [Spirodela intermedia]|uniref:Uncharacterized protein n=1 Tax=Spirodela intermedia TaxID=51605 RepID=A0A7I8IVN9_SPIIN|nr:unnamed protein product [Spirodela intermedia]CAA6662058.1 unnamed protein product [Spirodela intermedia]